MHNELSGGGAASDTKLIIATEGAVDVIFESQSLVRERRFRAWQEAICDVYVHVDVAAEEKSDYQGLIREARFGAVTLTDALLSQQVITRRRNHLTKLDKDCLYMQFVQKGVVNVVQSDSSVISNPAVGCLFSASDPYALRYNATARAFYLEMPREPFVRRLRSQAASRLTPTLNTGSGLGRIAVEFCSVLANESAHLDAATREKLGEQLQDVLALALDSGGKDAMSETSVRQARLRSIKAYIDAHLGNPNLTLASIAKNNDVSIRYLHHLFQANDISPSEWIWLRRLQRCYEMLTSPEHSHRSITEIAYSMGFSSSSHFSNLFREKFGMRPSSLRRSEKQ